MAFSELELKAVDRTVGDFCRRHSPAQHADQLRCIYEIKGHDVVVFEERPPWRGDGEWTRQGIAKVRFVRTRREWLLYWMRADLKWHEYEPEPMPRDLASLVRIVDEDKLGAFFG
jgi:hypothetical protein